MPVGGERSSGKQSLYISADGQRQLAQADVLTALGKLWLAGVTIDWNGFYARERRRRVSLPTYPFERQRYWIEPPRTRTLAALTARAFKGKMPDMADWFYRVTWEQSSLPAVTQQQTSEGPWLVFADTCGLGMQVVERLAQEGRTCICVQAGNQFAQVDEKHFIIRPQEPADYQSLCKALDLARQMPKTILHCWSLTQKVEASEDLRYFREIQERGFYSVLFLTRALGAQVYAEPLQMVVVSNYMQAVTECEVLCPEKATLLAACKVIPQENLNITCRSIDIAVPASRALKDTRLIERIIAECTALSNDLVVAYRGATRWIQTYQPMRLEAPGEDPPVLRQQGVYLITGGLGNVGLVLAEHLAKTVHARLVLVGRSGLPARHAWRQWLENHEATESTRRKIERIQALEELGAEVVVLQADIADERQMQAVMGQIEERFGVLHGVIHAAGISDEAAFRAVQDIGRKECEWHFQPKVYGTYALEHVLEGRALDFCVVFSSLAAVLGGLGFVGYTAANSFLDAFVAKHNQVATVSWISVNWDSWQVKTEAHGELGGTIAAFAMTPEEGVEAFTRLLASGATQIIQSTGDLQARIQQWINLEALQERGETARPDAWAASSARPNLPNAYVAPSGEYEQKIAEVWQQVLGIEQVGLYDNFFDLGGHSLMGTQLISRLRQSFQVNLPLATLFEAPTVAELALAIKMLLIEEIEKLDEEEVKSLL